MALTLTDRFFLLVLGAFGLSGCLGTDVAKKQINESSIADIVQSLTISDPSDLTPPNREAEMSEYLRFAVASSPEILALREAEVAARSQVKLAVSKSRPQVGASSTVGGYKADVFEGAVTEGASVSLTASQLLFDGGYTSGSISAAEVNLALAEAVTQTAVNRISGEAADAGVSLFLASAELQAVQSFKKELSPHVAQLKLMAQSGVIDRSVLDEINSRLLEIDLAEEEARNALSLAELDFSKYFGEAEAPNSEFVLPSYIDDVSLDKLSYSDVPAVKEASLRVLLAERQLEIAKSAFFPKVSAQAGSNSPMDPDEKMSAQAGVMLTYQLGDGGARKANLAGAEANLLQAKRSAEFLIDNTEKYFNSMTEKVNTTKNLLGLADKKQSILADQLNVAEKQIQTGQADISKIFDIKLQINEIKSRVRNGRAELKRTKIEIAAALGLFTE